MPKLQHLLGPALLVPALIHPGCGISRDTVAPAELKAERDRWVAKYSHDAAIMVEKVAERMKYEYDEHANGRLPGEPVYDVLILSGGGDYGSFGAGFLEGWETIAPGEYALPQFDLVTGISTGSLIAPFAFVGTKESREHIYELYDNPKSNWVTLSDWFFFLPWRQSLLDPAPLKEDIEKQINPALLAQVAEASRQKRVLAVGATNIDFGAMRIWDVGLEAERVQAGEDPENLYRLLFASSAIPGAFPAVEINGHLYADGGVIANLFYDPDSRDPTGNISVFKRTYPGAKLPKIRVWVIINNKICADPKVTQPHWTNVAARSLELSIEASVASTLQRMAVEARVARELDGIDLTFRYVAIPDEWTPPVEGMFMKETMDSLAVLGRKLGSDPANWRTEEPRSMIFRKLEAEFEGAAPGTTPQTPANGAEKAPAH